jgi:integrase
VRNGKRDKQTQRPQGSNPHGTGRHSDGAGLYLIVDPGGARRWAFLFRQNGRLREMGLGGLKAVPLATARELAAECRKTVALGGDPIANRKREVERKREAERAKKTFGEVADEFIKSHEAEWSSAKHVARWRMTIDVYAAALKPKPVGEVTSHDVLAVLRPIWTEKPETASRLRGRIEQILDAAKAAKLRTGDNPAEWKGNLKPKLSKPNRSNSHHGAMPYAAVPAFVGQLREQPGLAALAFEFAILTAARSGEALGAKWKEIDIEEAVWIIPASRMKGKREHRVPLSDRAMGILGEVGKFKTSEFVFPGRRSTAPLSNMALAMVLRRMKIEGATPHGFRSSFRDWCGDKTTFPREVAEAALSHAIGDKTEAAYRREDALAKRRRLMDAWAKYCEPRQAGGNVTPLRRNA